MKSSWPKYIVALILATTMTGCFTTYHRNELADLPKPAGLYGGSFIYDPWGYYGSDSTFHYFVYTYNRNNLTFQKAIRIPREEIRLEGFPESPKSDRQVVAVLPITSGDSVIFSKMETIQRGTEQISEPAH